MIIDPTYLNLHNSWPGIFLAVSGLSMLWPSIFAKHTTQTRLT